VQTDKIPIVAEYMITVKTLDTMANETFRHLNFNEIEGYQKAKETVIPILNRQQTKSPVLSNHGEAFMWDGQCPLHIIIIAFHLTPSSKSLANNA